MGAFLAFQSRAGGGADAFRRARSHVESRKELAASGEVADVAVKFVRGNGSGTTLARSERGWLLAAGLVDHPELAVDDTAGLLARLEEHGESELDALDGFFALVWADGDEWVVQTDAFGRLHVYVGRHDDGVFLSTSSVAVARAVGSEPDDLAAWEFLATGTMFEDRTPFRDVRRLAGPRRYRVRGGVIDEGKTTEAYRIPSADGSQDGDAARLLDTMLDVTRRWIPEDARPLPDLTGGLDSRLVVGCLREAGRSFEVTCTGGPRDDDIVAARHLADALGLTFRPIAPDVGRNAQRSFATVRRAAYRSDGEYDAAEYAAIAAIHEPHSGAYGCSVNGSGGEVFRNYWWDGSHLDKSGAGAAALLVHRFTHAAGAPAFLERRDAGAHFRGAIERVIATRPDGAWADQCDDAYLLLRMQCWQGGIASATNEIWSTVSPLMSRRVLEALYRIPYAQRLDNRLVFDLFERMPAPYAKLPLATGFPPQRAGVANAWRFVPGLFGQPRRLWPRVKRKLGWAKPDPTSHAIVRDLMASGAAEFLEPDALRTKVTESYRSFWETARDTGETPLPILGRLLALEFALRE